tara:strand:+ start:395 stop:2677 length:2283 start_codon:yes stop_codon:yes gene_type:complete
MHESQPHFIPLIFQGDTPQASPGYASRFSLYQGSGLPLAQFGGYLGVSGGGGDMYPTYMTRYNTVHNINSPLSMELSSDIIGNEIIMQADIEVTGNINYSNNKVVFILSSYQDDDYFCSVISYDYSTFNLNSIGESGIFESTVEIDPNWDINQITFVALVQSFNDDNILQAGSMEVPLDNLLNMDTQISDIIDFGGDNDGVANPGENINLTIDIINESMELIPSNSTISVSADYEGIEILEEQVFNDIDIPVGGEYGALIPINIDNDISLGDITLNITLNCDYVDNYSNELTYTKTFQRIFEVSLYQFGYPYILDSQVISSPAVIDLDGDDINEVIFGDFNGMLHVVDQEGNPRPGFPFDMGDQIWGSPAVADIDHDGDIEIVVCSKNKRILVLNSDGSEQFEYNTGQFLVGTPALGNIDDDDDLEILIGGYSGSNKLYAMNPDGSHVNGFPLELGEKMKAGVALADFNGNGKVDIVIGTNDENIYLIYDNGVIADGFPFEGDGDFQSEPIILDINGEKTIYAGSKDGTLYAINQFGEEIFSLETSDDVMASPSILELDGFGPIIFFGNDDGELYAVDSNGSILNGWPLIFDSDIVSSPLFSDFDSNGSAELVIATNDGSLHVIGLDNSSYSSSPFQYSFSYTGNAHIVDFDSDGDLEIFCGTADGLNVFDIKEAGESFGYWSEFKGGLKRDSYYESTFSGLLMGDVNNDGSVNVFDVITIVNYVLGEDENIDLSLADMNSDGSIDVFDIILVVNYILLS